VMLWKYAQHDVFKRREIGHEVKLLENEADLVGAIAGQLVLTELPASMPSTTTRPEVGCSRPPRILMSVVLPEPDAP